jgi:ferredoxin
LIQVAQAADVGPAFGELVPAATPPVAATFLLSNDKRTAIEFALDHLAKHAPRRAEEIALPEGAPFGRITVDKARCTMCMSCVGACPASALMDGGDRPMLKFLERNCVQCGLCEATCPEDAIRLEPRLLLTPAAREARVLNETQPFHCVRCQKPFGTRQMVEAMMGRLSGHSMFAGGAALRRLQMCADCRVVDMM